MKNRIICRAGLVATMMVLFFTNTIAQYKEFKLSANGDTINAVDKKGLKQGKWVISIGEVRGEPGYDEEGMYKNDQRTGPWRRYNSSGDIVGIENYMFGGKDGIQQYYTYLGVLVRQEEWKGFNPEDPYDTIPVYGMGSGEIINYKIVKAEQYSVKHGEWKYFDPETGGLIKSEKYERGFPVVAEADKKKVSPVSTETKKEKPKPQEILDFEKANRGKKIITGGAGL